MKELQSGHGGTRVLHDVSLDLSAGELVCILGANGAGKTTLLHTITGLVETSSGTICLNGEMVQGSSAESRVRRGLALVPEGRRVFGNLSVDENLRIGAYHWRRRSDAAKAMQARLGEVYELFPGLGTRRTQRADTLSGGEQQMLAIGRALMADPEVLLLDEPSLGLAPKIVEQIFEVIAGLRLQGTTMLLVEQNVQLALNVSTRGYVLANGRITANGTAEELRSVGLEDAYLGVRK